VGNSAVSLFQHGTALRAVAHAWASLLVTTLSAHAAEGMWTFNDFPFAKVEQAYGFRPSQAWLDHVRLSSLRLTGCSASFVSPHGLIQTNHHCVTDCIEQLSSATRDLIATGFYAKEAKDELACRGGSISQLVAITDVTDRVHQATADKGDAFGQALRTVIASIEKECAGSNDNVRCEVVDLYQGGIYNLYKYNRYRDLRLVFAPEQAIAIFGGDPDNFEFPRYNLDIAFLRAYANGKPLDTRANYLPYAKADAQPGELTFTVGHPGSTYRLDTVSSLEFRRDVLLPRELIYNSELRGILTEFSTRGPEQARIADGFLNSLENSLKSSKGEFEALVDPTIIRARAASERELREKVAADPQLQAEYGAAWDNFRATIEQYRGWRERYRFTAGGQGLRSDLFAIARTLVRHAAEVKKPDEQRLPEFTSFNLPSLVRRLDSMPPIHPELDKVMLTFSLTKLREALGPDDPFVKTVLGRKSPRELATEVIDGTGLIDVATRTRLREGGQAAIDASTDPMIALARRADPALRAMRSDYETKVEGPQARYATQIAKARFKAYGTSIYPDATGTLRVSYGEVKGYRSGYREVAPATTFAGLFERATGADPFKLPDTWIAAQAKLDPRQPFNFVTTNETVGGSSGSPVINKAGEIVGVLFDHNREGFGGVFGYDPAASRAISVNVGAIRAALSKVYGADRLLEELR
jgi:hypothetical protein